MVRRSRGGGRKVKEVDMKVKEICGYEVRGGMTVKEDTTFIIPYHKIGKTKSMLHTILKFRSRLTPPPIDTSIYLPFHL